MKCTQENQENTERVVFDLIHMHEILFQIQLQFRMEEYWHIIYILIIFKSYSTLNCINWKYFGDNTREQLNLIEWKIELYS